MLFKRTQWLQYFSISGLFLALVLFIYLLFFFGFLRATVFLLSFLAFAVVWSVYLRRSRFDLLHPLSFFLLSMGIGVVARSVYLVSGDIDVYKNLTFFLGKDYGFLLSGAVVIFIGTFFYALAFLVKPPKIDLGVWTANRYWNERNLRFLNVIILLLGLVFVGVYIDQMNISFTSIAGLSERRRIILEDSEFKYASLGYLSWGADLVNTMLYVNVVYLFGVKKTPNRIDWTFLGLLFLISFIVPFLNNSRAGVAMIILNSLFLTYYTGRKIKRSVLIAGFVAVVSILAVLTSFRIYNQTGEEADIGFFDALVGETVKGRSLFGIAKVSHIVDETGENVDYLYGESLFNWVFAPIPRTLWKEKPIVALGQEVAVEFYGRDKDGFGGIPPTFLGELFWNFGLIGVIFGMFLIGWVVHGIYQYNIPRIRSRPSIILIYFAVIMPLALGLPGGDFSRVMVGLIMALLSYLILLRIIMTKFRSTENAG